MSKQQLDFKKILTTDIVSKKRKNTKKFAFLFSTMPVFSFLPRHVQENFFFFFLLSSRSNYSQLSRRIRGRDRDRYRTGATQSMAIEHRLRGRHTPFYLCRRELGNFFFSIHSLCKTPHRFVSASFSFKPSRRLNKFFFLSFFLLFT